MALKSSKHRYSQVESFERLMILIATLLIYPGVGCREELTIPTNQHHDALKLVQRQMQKLAARMNLNWSENYPATPTIRKDLEQLREYGILDRRMYRWGYYLGTGVMNKHQLKLAFNALASQAVYQGDPQLRQTYKTLSRRLRGFEFEEDSFFYPVRQHLDRAIDYTDPEEMMNSGQNRHTLFHQIEAIEQAILEAQAVKLARSMDLYGKDQVGLLSVWPLQLIYYNIAWYLLYEEVDTGHLAIGRVSRFKDYLEILPNLSRNLEAQKHSLQQSYKLIHNGWGLYLGDRTLQQLELNNKLDFVSIQVRFFPPVSAFIQEGELRHPRQKLKVCKDNYTGKTKYIDYSIKLPPRSLNEFSFWVHRYMDKAVVLSPPELVAKHRESAIALASRYQAINS